MKIFYKRFKEVEIISDLDLVEIATIEYKLPGYQPLTYRGQKILCEDLCIKFVNSTSCDRDNVLNYSNLRKFIPSQLLPIPGDGNCLIFFVVILVDRKYRLL